MNYSALVRPEKNFTQELLARIYQSGCRILMWGMESFSQRVHDELNKGLQVRYFSDVLKASYEAGICNLIFYMFGLPNQKIEDLDADYEFLRSNMEYITTFSFQAVQT